MAEKIENWEPTCERYVAFLDIMGFKDMVLNRTTEELINIFEKIRKVILFVKEEPIKLAETHVPVSSSQFISPVSFSDSTILVSYDGSLGSAYKLFSSVAIITSQAIKSGIPIKGAIAYGKMTAVLGKSIYFGKPLIAAYELQNELLLYGVIVHHTVEQHLIQSNDIEKFEDFFIFKYPVPMKSGKITHYVVDFTPVPEKEKELLDSVTKLYNNVSGAPRIYVDNTLKYIEWVNERKEKLKQKENK
jgi:hypothetical protein